MIIMGYNIVGNFGYEIVDIFAGYKISDQWKEVKMVFEINVKSKNKISVRYYTETKVKQIDFTDLDEFIKNLKKSDFTHVYHLIIRNENLTFIKKDLLLYLLEKNF
jgi:hypothetical protein